MIPCLRGPSSYSVTHDLGASYTIRFLMTGPGFNDRRVLVLESRRARELAAIVTSYGGRPLVAPSMREVPLESNTEAIAFSDALIRGEFDLVILLTGVGTRTLVDAVQRAHGAREPFVEALRRTKVAARGPKPVAVLRELQVPVWVTAPEPNTWRELMAALDARAGDFPFAGKGNGTLNPGRIIEAPQGTPMTNLYLSLLDRMGAKARRIGDSTGPRGT